MSAFKAAKGLTVNRQITVEHVGRVADAKASIPVVCAKEKRLKTMLKMSILPPTMVALARG